MEVLLCDAHVFEHRIPRHHVYHLDEPIEVFGAAPALDEQLNLVRDKSSRYQQINSCIFKNHLQAHNRKLSAELKLGYTTTYITTNVDILEETPSELKTIDHLDLLSK